MLLLDSDELLVLPFPLLFAVVVWAAPFVWCWALWPWLPLELEEDDDWRCVRKNESRRDPLEDEEEVEEDEDVEVRFESDIGP